MTETELQLYKLYTVTLDSTGLGRITDVGPVQHGERWRITATQCSVANSTSASKLLVYKQGQTQVVEGTYSGNQDNSDTVFDLQAGERLTYEFSGGDANAIAQITIRGTQFLRGQRAY